MAPKRLADIAAPAPEVVAEPVAEVKKESAKQRARIDKGLAETRVTSVTVDGLTLMKIIKHAREAHQVIPAPQGTSNATVTFSPAVGQLLGIDSEGSLRVSNAFALPAGALGGSSSDSEGENRGLKAGQYEELLLGGTSRAYLIEYFTRPWLLSASKYSAAVLSRMIDLNADGSIVGFYTSTNNGQTLAISGFVEALIGAQMSGGGVGSGLGKATPVGRAAATKTNLVPGQGAKNGKGIALVYDVASAAQGHVGLKAYRLSAAFVEAYRAGKFDTQSLIDHKLVPSNILEEVPVTVHSSSLLTAFLSTLVTPSSSSTNGASQSSSVPLDPLSTYSQLSLPTSSTSSNPSPLTTPLTALLSALETHQAHLSTLSFQSRQLGRDRARLESNPAVVRRRIENEQRAKEGLPPLALLPEELALQEPSRLETMCALNAVQGAAKALNQATGTGLVRSYGAKAGTVG